MNKLFAVLAIISITASSVNAGAAVLGNAAQCGTANTGGPNSSDCVPCGATLTIQGLFTMAATPTCKVTDCSADPTTNLNGWMCNSCNGVVGAHTAYTAGKFLQGTACAASCSTGYTADPNQICQPNGGAVVGCGTANAGGPNSSDCNGCGASAAVRNLFKVAATPNCKVIDCALDPSTNLNGWMCKSCTGQTGAHSAYSAGAFLKTGACVAACGTGYTADVNNICQKNPVLGADVACGTANASGPKSTDCKGCGVNTTIQGLFTQSATPNCDVTDCGLDPSTNLNGWMCKSCNGQTGAHTAYNAGKYFSGSACVASCPTGQTADANNICQGASGSSTGSYLLTLAFTMLLLCLLF